MFSTASSSKTAFPHFRPGDTVKVYSKVVEGGKERTQMFEGVVIVRKGGGAGESITVRRIAHGVGVEKSFLLAQPARRDASKSASAASCAAAASTISARRSVRAARIKEKKVKGNLTRRLTPLQLLGLICVFAIARVALSTKPFAAGTGPRRPRRCCANTSTR